MFSSIDLARRSFAAGLLALIGGISFAPLISLDSQSNLPACCRRDGQHRCAMQQMDQPFTSSGFAAASPTCPLFPKSAPAPFGFHLYPFGTRALRESMVNQPSDPMQAEVERRVSAMRANHKRGPPPSISRG